MILVDRRIGSGDLIDLLPTGLALLDTLRFGDVAFLGQGPNSTPVRIGIELKALGDACASIRSGRFAGHQLPGLLQDYDRVYVVVEGMYRPGPEGELQTFRRGQWGTAEWGHVAWMYSELDGWINSITEHAAIRVKRTSSRKETAAVVLGLYRWWSKKYELHKSHVGFDESGKHSLLVKPGLVRRVAAELPMIGWERSGAVAEKFKTVRDLANSQPQDWTSIEGIGKVIANRVVNAINGKERGE